MKSKGFLFFSFVIIAALFYIRKNESLTLKGIRSKDIIECAEVIPFDSLTKKQQDEVKYTIYYPSDNWYKTAEFDKKDSYFVKAVINNQYIAELSQSEAFTVEKLFKHGPSYLYGKYKNRWAFSDNATIPISETSKFKGFDIFEITRKGQRDFLIIGPIPDKPSNMEIHMLGDKKRILSKKLLDKNCY